MREFGTEAVGCRGLGIVSALATGWGIHDGSSHIRFQMPLGESDASTHPAPALGEDARPDALDHHDLDGKTDEGLIARPCRGRDHSSGMEAPTTTFCVIPAGTDPAVIDELHRLYEEDPLVTVIVERRAGKVRRVRRGLQSRAAVQRRLPAELARLAPDVRFEDHLPPIDEIQAYDPIHEVAARAARFDASASAELRWRCHTRVVSLLTVRLGNERRAARAFPRVMDQVQASLETLPDEEEFYDWLVELIDRIDLKPT